MIEIRFVDKGGLKRCPKRCERDNGRVYSFDVVIDDAFKKHVHDPNDGLFYPVDDLILKSIHQLIADKRRYVLEASLDLKVIFPDVHSAHEGSDQWYAFGLFTARLKAH